MGSPDTTKPASPHGFARAVPTGRGEPTRLGAARSRAGSQEGRIAPRRLRWGQRQFLELQLGYGGLGARPATAPPRHRTLGVQGEGAEGNAARLGRFPWDEAWWKRPPTRPAPLPDAAGSAVTPHVGPGGDAACTCPRQRQGAKPSTKGTAEGTGAAERPPAASRLLLPAVVLTSAAGKASSVPCPRGAPSLPPACPGGG